MLKKFICAALLTSLVPAAIAAAPSINLALDAAKDVRERARFPEWSRPVLAGQVDPILAKREATTQSQAGPNGAAPRLTVWASGLAFEAGQAVDLFAKLEDRSQNDSLLASLRPISAKITGELAGENTGPLAQLDYADDGRAPDVRAGDGIYSARHVLAASRAPAAGRAESIMVTVRAITAAGDFRSAVGGFQYSNPGARLTGNFRDVIRNGNLVLQAEAEVLATGRYHLSGTLANLADEPVAYAQTARVLQPGRQWLDLSYYGLVFHERGLLGKARLASITLTSASQMPNALGPVLRNAHLTQILNLALLTRLPFNDPEMLDAARRLEASALPLK